MFAEDTLNRLGWLRKPIDIPSRNQRIFDRAAVAGLIAQTLLSFEDRGNNRPIRRLQDLPPKEADRFREIGEMAVMLLEPDREQTAVMAAADRIVQGNYGGDVMTMFHLAKKTQRTYLRQTQSAINAYRETLRIVTPDPNYEDKLCRLLDDLTREAK